MIGMPDRVTDSPRFLPASSRELEDLEHATWEDRYYRALDAEEAAWVAAWRPPPVLEGDRCDVGGWWGPATSGLCFPVDEDNASRGWVTS